MAVIEEMIDKYHAGNDIVYGVRSARKTDTFFKKFTAQGFYKMMQLMGVDIVYNHADYRLMSRRALEGLEEFKRSARSIWYFFKILLIRNLLPFPPGYPGSSQ